tara:strand:- start:14085 stop:14543 length:459 start_codon:yes stop_codon:yes gene_type:complete
MKNSLKLRNTMTSIENLQDKYKSLDDKFNDIPKGSIDSSLIIVFDYDYSESGAEVVIETDEFTAVCPWTELPDFGTLTINYVPEKYCLELKSLKYYLLSYTGVGIVQEHAANKILDDLVAACNPKTMKIILDYKIRGGLHTSITVEYDSHNI